ncbi:secreted RxLR effector peptide protein, putative [Phytophthora infestans T30-4]|uniref:RxLR effector protein n=2 Tax=Phytophthora infestans TaxID=4787 RepID=D0NCP6_PHYIT|nr:secreted RxLR effector peptide protein, putative [Phytophthora infestans T30-4]EEY55760.1 secreted RxLR effector peptide protein, putative [Phytophthora infestans T30-4]KAF4030616.1 hypothetical protein GN244_ATG17592 [Phytophthora infestans]KAF4139616.1 hypothetical protein GN958_ATG11101 [Phytophthora infestans]|eukprot:XP_002903336.1 secreted RxLR effector peptide protein, putative [Phytophthora infestans T30-4]
MRGFIILLAIQVTVTILAHGTGAVDIETLATTRSGIVQDPAVAGHVTNNVQRLLRKHEDVNDGTEHDKKSTNEERDVSTAVKAFAEKLKSIWTVGKVADAMDGIPTLQRLGQADHIDELIKAMLAGKNADDVSKDMMARTMTIFQMMDERRFTPSKVKMYIAEKKVVLTPEDAHYFTPLFSAYWKAAHVGKKLE